MWGQCELQPFCFGLQQLVMAAVMPEVVPLDDLVELIEGPAVEGVSSCEVRSVRRVVDDAE